MVTEEVAKQLYLYVRNIKGLTVATTRHFCISETHI